MQNRYGLDGSLRILMRLLALFFVLSPVIAQAQKIYSCKDPSGRTISSDRPIAECDKVPMRELRKDGSTLRVIEAPLTPEQQKAREAAALQKKQEEEQKVEQRRRDAALLSLYATEGHLQQARTRQVAQVEDDIKLAQQRMQLAQKNLDEAQKEAKGYPQGKRLPIGLQQRLTQGEATVTAEQGVVESKRAEILKINQKFDLELARYRELNANR